MKDVKELEEPIEEEENVVVDRELWSRRLK